MWDFALTIHRVLMAQVGSDSREFTSPPTPGHQALPPLSPPKGGASWEAGALSHVRLFATPWTAVLSITKDITKEIFSGYKARNLKI